MNQGCSNINDVVKEFYNYIKAYVFKKVKNKEIAEDVVQEVMLKLVESHQKSKEIKNIKAWLFQVSRNTIYDYYNRNKLEFNLENDWNLESQTSSEVSKIVTSDFVIPMIHMLPKEDAVPLKLSDIDKIPQKDIANQLNLSLSAVKMRVRRARTKLRTMFVDCCEINYNKHGEFLGCSIKDSCDPLQKVSKDLAKKQSS